MERIYDEVTEHKIKEEFQRLEGQCYLDHAGATLYSEIQMKNVCEDLCSNVFGNPHSHSLHSKKCTDVVEEVRNRILRHFHTNSSKYSLIFTSGATAAIRLVVENFDWRNENEDEEIYFDTNTSFPTGEIQPGAYIYTQSNHTSIIGGREAATEKGVPFYCLGYDESFSIFGKTREVEEPKMQKDGNSIFAYPAQCNFSGRKYPLDWIEKTQNGVLDTYGMTHGRKRNSKWFVLLDAATYSSTCDLNLSVHSPDFVCISFYKIFGYPTGLGALLVRNSSAYVLKKTYFGGGTVEISLTGQDFRRFRKILHERFEDGTISFLSIIALNHGLKTLERLNLNMKIISQHVFSLASYAYHRMKALKHWNGEPLVRIYADSDYSDIKAQGGIINFNLLRSDGNYIGFTEVLHIANLHNIQFRTGCFCNSGACQRHLRLSDDDLKMHHKAGHVCGGTMDIINGRPTGSIRISFGYMTTPENIDQLIQMLAGSFLEVRPTQVTRNGDINHNEVLSNITLKKIWTYPVKSCGAMEVDSWKLSPKGLEYDREWMIIGETGVCLTQKQEPKMSLIVPELDLTTKTLKLSYRTSHETITIPIENDTEQSSKFNICESKVCQDRIIGHDCGDEIGDWLSRQLNMKGLRLIRQSSNDQRKNKTNENSNGNEENGKLSLSNQAQYLLINNQSVMWLRNRIEPGDDINMDTFVHRFRGNFLVEGATAFSENTWSVITIGSVGFKVAGPCGRCQMICIDQYTAQKSRKPLIALSRALNGKMRFGVYLSHVNTNGNSIINVGDEISIQTYE